MRRCHLSTILLLTILFYASAALAGQNSRPDSRSAEMSAQTGAGPELQHTYTDNCPLCRQNSLQKYITGKLEEFQTEYPELYAFAGEDNVREFIRISLEKGKKHNLDADREINGIRIMMLYLGSGFDEDPMYPWARLKTFPPKDYTEKNPDSWIFIQEIYAKFYRFFQEATGDDLKYLRKAGKRLLLLNFGDIAILQTDAQILKMLAEVYPERYAMIPEDALVGPVLQAAEKMAVAHNMTQQGGKALFAGMIFYYGISVDSNPLYRNLFTGLGEEAPHLSKEAALFFRLQKLVRQDMGM